MGASIFDKTSPFSTPTKPSPKLTSSVEAKENRVTSPCLPNQMKSSTKKNFMSPTISAASKTVAHRKKILAERNGGSEATEPTFCAKLHRRRSSSFDLKQDSFDIRASTDSLTSSINEICSFEDGLNDAKMKPYDPVLNYCSPRPKFLLYKPDRRSEILRRYEMFDVTSSESESSFEQEECVLKQSKEVTEEAGEIDNLKEHGVPRLDENVEGSVKVIHVEENVENVDHNEVCENLEDHEEVYESIENHRQEIKYLENDAEMVKDQNLQHMETEEGDEEGEFEEEGEVERYWSFKSLLKLWSVIVVLGLSTLYLSSMNSISLGLNGDELKKIQIDLQRTPFIHDNASGYVIQNELAKMAFDLVSHRIKNEIVISESDHYIDEPLDDVNDMKNEGSYVKVEADEVEAAENETEAIKTEEHKALTEVVELNSHSSEAANDETDVLADGNYHIEMTLDETVAVEEVVSTKDVLDEGLSMRYSKETVKTAIIGVASSLFLAVIGFIGYQKLKRTDKTMQEDTIRRQRRVAQVDHFAYNNVVGEKQVSSYSFSQKNMKMSTSHPNVSGFSSTTSTPPFGGESSSHRRIHKIEVPTSSSIDSPSYGSFTAEMMFRTKEQEARGVEKTVVTPVRRSSRIHSRRTPGTSQ